MESTGHNYEVVLLGNSGVGKTTFFNHLKENTSPNNVDSDVCTKTYTFGEETVKVSGTATSHHTHSYSFISLFFFLFCYTPFQFKIWDTGGHEGYRSITPSYYRRANLVICMYSVAKVPHSIYDLKRWIENAKTHAVNPSIVLIANDPEGLSHSDRELKGTSEDFQKEFDVRSHFRLSACSKQQVEETFCEIAKTFHEESRESNRCSVDKKLIDISKPDKQSCINC